MSYNGWANYETWSVKLWIDNADEGFAEMVREMARDSRDIYSLSQSLKDMIDEINPLGDEAALFSDLLTAALSEVNWYEIAEAYFEEEHDDDDDDDDQQED